MKSHAFMILSCATYFKHPKTNDYNSVSKLSACQNTFNGMNFLLRTFQTQ